MNSLGESIRKERKRRRLTINDLAERIGFSDSYISQVERDLIVPSLSALRQIAGAFDVTPGFLLDNSMERDSKDDESDIAVIRKDERLILIYPGSKVKNELLLPEYDPNFSITWLTFPPNSRTSPIGDRTHRGKHHCVVVSGSILFESEKGDYYLETGDALLYDYVLDHTWVNEQNTPAEIVLYTQPAEE